MSALAWKTKRLKYTCRVNPPPPRLPDDQTVSFIPMEAVSERGGLDLSSTRPAGKVKLGYTAFADGDVLMAKITPCFENGKGSIASGLVGGIGFGTTELHVLRPVSCELRWLFYVTQSNRFMGQGEGSMYGAGGQKRVPPEFVKNFEAETPPLPTQRAIADFLDRKTAAIDALIEKKERLIALLAEKRAALIHQAVTKGLDGAASGPDVPMKDSGVPWIGEIPAHWEVKRLKFLLNGMEQGWSPECEQRVTEEGEWGVLKVGCVNYSTWNELEHKALPAEIKPRVRFEIRAGDVLMSRANTSELVGSVALVDQVRPRLLLCDKLYRLVVRESVNTAFLVFALNGWGTRLQHEMASSGASSSMQNISQGKAGDIVLVLPPPNEQAEVAGRLKEDGDRSAKLRDHIAEQLARLREYRQSLITAAVTGQLDIGEHAP